MTVGIVSEAFVFIKIVSPSKRPLIPPSSLNSTLRPKVFPMSCARLISSAVALCLIPET